MHPVVTFPDAVEVVIRYLASVFPSVQAHPRVPSTLPDEFIDVRRIGGQRRDVTTDRPRVDIGVWATSDDDAVALASTVRAYIGAMAGPRHGTTVSNVTEIGGLQNIPDEKTGKPRYKFAVDFSMRGTELE